MRRLLPCLVAAATQIGACNAQTSPPAVTREVPTIVAAIPHDRTAYTEGLFIRDGRLWESTGNEGASELRETDLATGRVLRRTSIPNRSFGEGSIAVGGDIVSLTWKEGVAYRWDARTLRLKGTFRYPGEGWALTRMGTGSDILMSDGTPELRVIDLATFKERRRIRVTLQGTPVERLNEIEWVDGEIWANVWMEDAIVRIDPASGHVIGIVDLSTISRLQPSSDPNDVANGIAWDAVARRLFITGKRWSSTYRIDVPSLHHGKK